MTRSAACAFVAIRVPCTSYASMKLLAGCSGSLESAIPIPTLSVGPASWKIAFMAQRSSGPVPTALNWLWLPGAVRSGNKGSEFVMETTPSAAYWAGGSGIFVKSSSKLMIVPNLGVGQPVLPRVPRHGTPEKNTGAAVAGAGSAAQRSPRTPSIGIHAGQRFRIGSPSPKSGPTFNYRARRRSQNAILQKEGPVLSHDGRGPVKTRGLQVLDGHRIDGIRRGEAKDP